MKRRTLFVVNPLARHRSEASNEPYEWRVAGPGSLAAIMPCAFLMGILALFSFPLAMADAETEATVAQFPPGIRIVQAAYQDDLPGLKKRGEIRVLTIYSRSYFFIEDGRAYGLVHDMFEAYGSHLNRHRSRGQPEMEIVFIPVPLDRLIESLNQGYGDVVAAGLTVTGASARRGVFTRPWLTDVSHVVVSNRSLPGLDSECAMAGRRVLVKRGSSYAESLASLNRVLEKQGMDPVEIVYAPDALATEGILELVNAGTFPITVLDGHLARLWSQVMPNLKVHENLVLSKGGRIAWLVRKNNPELLKSLNRFVAGHQKGTLLGNILFKRYFQENRWLKDPLVPSDRMKFSKYAPLFKKYGHKYNIDWRLLAAQAYQESGLDPRRRSPVGAVGLMQIMPGLVPGSKVSMEKLMDPDYNIHVGARYLASIRDQHYDIGALKPTSRMPFALAAYNAGPYRLQDVRQYTARMGYDPDLWFFNAEYGTLHLAGSQPVTYVRNIYKYYVAYIMSEEMEKTRQKDVSRWLRERLSP